MLKRIFSILFILFSVMLYAQSEADSLDALQIAGERETAVESNQSPGRAALFSALLPGAGQVYNKKYWKLPIIYAGIGISVYLGVRYYGDYIRYRDAYRLEINGDSSEFHGLISNINLVTTRDQYKQWMETSFLIAGAFYLLNIIDASVDAHLMDFDISDDLSMRIKPDVMNFGGIGRPAPSLTIAFYLKAPPN